MDEAKDLDFDEDECCVTCDGLGEIMVCCDDMCHGSGYCVHGDGMIICPTCKGDSNG